MAKPRARDRGKLDRDVCDRKVKYQRDEIIDVVRGPKRSSVEIHLGETTNLSAGVIEQFFARKGTPTIDTLLRIHICVQNLPNSPLPHSEAMRIIETFYDDVCNGENWDAPTYQDIPPQIRAYVESGLDDVVARIPLERREQHRQAWRIIHKRIRGVASLPAGKRMRVEDAFHKALREASDEANASTEPGLNVAVAEITRAARSGLVPQMIDVMYTLARATSPRAKAEALGRYIINKYVKL